MKPSRIASTTPQSDVHFSKKGVFTVTACHAWHLQKINKKSKKRKRAYKMTCRSSIFFFQQKKIQVPMQNQISRKTSSRKKDKKTNGAVGVMVKNVTKIKKRITWKRGISPPHCHWKPMTIYNVMIRSIISSRWQLHDHRYLLLLLLLCSLRLQKWTVCEKKKDALNAANEEKCDDDNETC